MSMRLAQSKLSSLEVTSRKDAFTVVSPRDSFVSAEIAGLAGGGGGRDARGGRRSVEGVGRGQSLRGGRLAAWRRAPRRRSRALPSGVRGDHRREHGERRRRSEPAHRLRARRAAERQSAAAREHLRRCVQRPRDGRDRSRSRRARWSRTGPSKYVYVEAPKGKFSRREVTAGSSRGGLVQVFKGLAPGETVVVKVQSCWMTKWGCLGDPWGARRHVEGPFERAGFSEPAGPAFPFGEGERRSAD